MYQIPGTPPPPSTSNFIPELPRCPLVLNAALERGEKKRPVAPPPPRPCREVVDREVEQFQGTAISYVFSNSGLERISSKSNFFV